MLGAVPKKSVSHGPAGGKAASFGVNYQLAVLMYTFLKGLLMKVDFWLGTEVKEAGKFGDVIYRYKKGVEGKRKRINRLVQVKNKSDPDKSRITLSSLLSKNSKSDFSLSMYFKSFRDIKANFSKGNEEIGDMVIYTNGWINWEDKAVLNKGSDDQITFIMKNTFEKDSVEDELWKTQLYRFTKGTEERRKWVKYLTENSSRKDSELEGDVELFLDKISVAINQPEEKDLIDMVLKELKHYVNSNVQEAYAQFHTYMHKWLTGKECCYLYREDGLKLVEDLRRKYGGFKFGVSRPVLNFSGRENELDDLRKIFEKGNQRVVICGLGGVGKTQLAKKFVERQSDSYNCVMWLKSECYEDLECSFKRLAFDTLRIREKTDEGTPRDIESILEEVKQVLQNRKCIIIFDNIRYMGDGSTGMSKLDVFLRKLPDKAKLLMTSRCDDWDNFFIYPLKSLSNKDATQLIKTSLNGYIIFEDKQVKDLAKEMQNFPLAIQQAIAYIKRKAKKEKKFSQEYGINSYLQKFQKNFKKLLEHHVQEHDEDEYFKTTLTTWDITMEDIRKEKCGKLSEKILEKISYFFPDGIRNSDIKLSFSDEAENQINAAILLLDEYSMVNIVNRQCTVHRLVQRITRLRVKQKKEEFALLDSLFRECTELDIRNVVSIWKHCAEHKNLIIKYAYMPTDVIWMLADRGSYTEGYMYGKMLIKVMETMLDPMDMNMIQVNSVLALLLYEHGMLNECYNVYKKACRCSDNKLGEKHPITLENKSEMALVLKDLEKFDESYEILKEVSPSMDAILGRDHLKSIQARMSLAIVLKHFGRYDESYIMMKEVCDTNERIYGAQDAYFNDSSHQLGLLLQIWGKHEESFDILKKVWEWSMRNITEEHPDTLSPRTSMGLVLYKLGNYAESLEIYEEVFECRSRILGKQHPKTLETETSMVLVIKKLGPYCNLT